MPTIHVQVFEQGRLAHQSQLAGPLEVGRQQLGETFQPPATRGRDPASGRERLVIAPSSDPTIARQQLLLEPGEGDAVKITNLSDRVAVQLGDGWLGPRATGTYALPAALGLDQRAIKVIADPLRMRSLSGATLPPGSAVGPPSGRLPVPGRPAAPQDSGLEVEELVRWLQGALDVLHSATSSDGFFEKAAQAVVELVGMDTGGVFLCQGDNWRVAATHTARRAAAAGQEDMWRPSRQVLGRVRQEKRTFWQLPDDMSRQGSLVNLHAVVASPILDAGGEVIGAVYGDRRLSGRGGTTGLTIERVEALLVEVLARTVAAGLARLAQEQQATAARVQFEQFFTPALARQLIEQPDLLAGRDATVTVLFCDIRRFSRLSGLLGPGRTLDLIGDVMEQLSECVLAEDGVLVDYIGDELLAMWGSPVAQPDHGPRAVRAGLAMLGRLPDLDTRWSAVFATLPGGAGERLELGVGIGSGPARVGNTGSKYKFKYGPLGPVVNLASRVQGATKYLKCPLLVTQAARELLGDAFATRRVSTVRAVNIADAVDLFEVSADRSATASHLRAEYETALGHFHAGQLRQAARILAHLATEFPDDGPTLVLLSRCVTCLVESPVGYDPVYELPGK